MYLERRRRRWFAFHDLPAAAQKALGKKRLSASLETEDRKIAERRASILKAQWLADIERAVRGSGDRLERDAEYWRRLLLRTPEAEKDLVMSLIADEASNIVEPAGWRAGILDDSDPRFAALPEYAQAERFYQAATGKLVKFDAHLEEHLAPLQSERKTIDMKRSTVTKFSLEFPYVQDIQRSKVQRWANEQVQAGKAVATVNRCLGELRGYWTYLQSAGVVPEDALPFNKLSLPKPGKKEKEDKRLSFQPREVVKLLCAARDRGDDQRADLIELGRWTGARIEELCSLPVSKVTADHFTVEDAKTEAGWRTVPIHPKLKVTMKRLVKSTKDGFVMSGLSENKYGDRSGALGTRFGRLKTSMGFGPRHVFHSIRKTVSTLLENAGVPENVAADILGHDKPTMTYGLYSGGASLAVKREALKKIAYPG
jgi:integrase